MSFPDSPHLATGDGTQVGILTLWTKKEHVMARVPKKQYAVCSQLYSRDEGVSMLVRSLLKHKEIRDLVMVGADLNGCSDALLALWENGVQDGQVVGAPGYVDPEIPPEAIDRLRKNVRLHDKRDVKEYQDLNAFIDSLEDRGSWGEPESYPEPEIQPPAHYPQGLQHILRHAKIRDAAIDLAHRLERLGVLRNVQVQFTKDRGLPEDLVDDAESYTAHLLDDQEGTYGEQIGWKDLRIQQRLADEQTFSVSLGTQAHPSLDTISFDQTKEVLCVYAHLSRTELTEIPLLAKALFTLARNVSDKQPILTINVTHLEPDAYAKRLAKQQQPVRRTGDPAGNLLVRLRDKEIQVTHLSPDGKRLEQFSGTNGEVLYRKIVQEYRASDLSHAAYLGYELGKAEYALKTGQWYEQDLPLTFQDDE